MVVSLTPCAGRAYCMVDGQPLILMVTVSQQFKGRRETATHSLYVTERICSPTYLMTLADYMDQMLLQEFGHVSPDREWKVVPI